MLADEIVEIKVNDIFFSYPTVEDATQNTAISNVSFTIKSGEKIAIVEKKRIGEAGENLSGGQRQRILIARALVNNVKLLLD